MNTKTVKKGDSIQGAIDSASDEDIIKVNSGTFEESILTVDKNLTIEGPNAGTPGDHSRNDEAVIKLKSSNTPNSGGAAVKITNQGVTIDGFEIQSAGQDGISVAKTVDDVTIRNNRITRVEGNTFSSGSGDRATANGIAFGLPKSASETTVRDAVVKNNKITGVTTEDLSSSEDRTTANGVQVLTRQDDVKEMKIQGNVISDSNGSALEPGSPGSSGDKRARGIVINVGSNGGTIGSATNFNIKYNEIKDIVGNGESSDVVGVALFEAGKAAGSSQKRIGPEDFDVKDNIFDRLTNNGSGSASAVFVGGYETLGSNHSVTQNDFLDGNVVRFDGNQTGYTPSNADILNAADTSSSEYNYFGADNGPTALDRSTDNPTDTIPGTGDGVAVTNKIDFVPFYDARTGQSPSTVGPVTNSSTPNPKREIDEYGLIQPAVNAANSSDTIKIAAGTYDEQVVINRDSDASGLTLEAEHSSSPPTIEQTGTSNGGGEPTVAVDQDHITLKNLEITRTATNDRAAQAVRVAGNSIALENNNCEVEGSNNAAIAVLTSSSGAAGNPSFTGTIDSVTIDDGTITASTDNSADGEVGVLVADDGSASLVSGAVEIGSSRSVGFTVAESNDHALELDTGGGVINRQDVLTGNGNTFNTQSTSASAASPDSTDQDRNGFSIDELIASTVQDAVDAAASTATVDVLDGTFSEKVSIGENITLTGENASNTPVIDGQVRVTGSASNNSNRLRIKSLDIDYNSNNSGGGKDSTVLFENNQHVGVTLDNNTITAPGDGFAVYKNKSGGGTSSPDNNVTLSNNTFDTNGTANQLVVIRSELEGRSSGGTNKVNVTDNIFSGKVDRNNISTSPTQRGSVLDHRANDGDIRGNDLSAIDSSSPEPLASATGDKTSIRHASGGNSGLVLKGDSVAGNDIQTVIDESDPNEIIRITNEGNGQTFTIAQNGSSPNQNQIEINAANVTLEGSGSGTDEIQVPDSRPAIEISGKDNVDIKKVGITDSGSGDDTGIVISGSSSNCTVRDNTITVNPNAAIDINGGSNNVIEGNRLEAESSGGAGVLIKSTGGSGNLIALNDIDSEFANGVDIQSDAGAGNVTVQFNNLRGNTAGIRNNDDENVDARSNFWGDKTGPSGDVDDPETGRTADGDGNAIDNGSNAGVVRYDEFLEISNDFILNTGSPPDGRDTDGDNLHEDFNDDSDHFPTDGYLFLRAFRQGHFDRLRDIDGTGGKLSTDYTTRFDFDGDDSDGISRSDVVSMVINRNRD